MAKENELIIPKPKKSAQEIRSIIGIMVFLWMIIDTLIIIESGIEFVVVPWGSIIGVGIITNCLVVVMYNIYSDIHGMSNWINSHPVLTAVHYDTNTVTQIGYMLQESRDVTIMDEHGQTAIVPAITVYHPKIGTFSGMFRKHYIIQMPTMILLNTPIIPLQDRRGAFLNARIVELSEWFAQYCPKLSHQLQTIDGIVAHYQCFVVDE